MPIENNTTESTHVLELYTYDVLSSFEYIKISCSSRVVAHTAYVLCM